MKFFYTFIFIIFCNIIYSQNSVISGVIVDDATGATMPGVNVVIKSLNLSTSSDSDGKFIFRNVKPGIYEVEFTNVGFQPKIISEVIVAQDETVDLNVSLIEIKNLLDEIVITVTRAKAESVKSLLLMQKNSASVTDGISAETIRKTPDRTTSDVLKRISGASIQENKFVIIRGLNDRYNTALLNGAPLPSSEPDRKAFSFDIFPSNMLDNIIINKTASPDLPGEFAGGIVQINTKSVPDKDFQSITIGSGYNTVTTFKEQRTYKGSPTDWLGYDNGTRASPSGIPGPDTFILLSVPEKVEVARLFNSDWKISDSRFSPNTSFQYSLGRHFNFKDKVLGVLFSLTNTKNNNFNQVERFGYESVPLVVFEKFNDSEYVEQVLTAGLLNLSFKFNENHSINFKNILSLNSTDLVVERSGKLDIRDVALLTSDARWFTSNNIYSGQFNLENYFSKLKIKINSTAFYSNIERSIPNLRRNAYFTPDPNSEDPTQTIPIAIIAGSGGSQDTGGGIFYSENSENIKGGKIDVSKKFDIGKDLNNEFKIGGFIQSRSRDFFARQHFYNTYSTATTTFDNSLLSLPNESIFSSENIGATSAGLNGFTIFDLTKLTDDYQAGSDLKAAYFMLDNRYKRIRVVWGVRLEDFVQTLNSDLSATEKLAQVNRQQDFLPSLNLIYSINKKQNLRFSYSRTLNRPEFRELAPFGFYDFRTQIFTEGNDSLKIAKVKNIDFRYELYPGKGQLFSVSYFRKNFTNPIEVIRSVRARTVSYANAISAVNSGFEFEFRTLLSSIFTNKNTRVFDDLTLFSNIAIIKSEADVNNINAANIDKTRPMQGQSPYIFNAGLQYLNTDNGWSVSTNINRAGNRILFAEGELEEALWEKARTFLDMQISKTFNKNKIEIKLNIQNLLAQDLIFYQNQYLNTGKFGTIETLANQIFTGDYRYEDGFNEDDDVVVWRTKFGRSFSLALTYNF